MERNIKDIVDNRHFDSLAINTSEGGQREMNPLYPFVISGGKNTEHWYFKHISDITEYKFNVFPEYFGDENNYTKEFPARIDNILKKTPDALIFCVWDWDTIRNNDTNLKKHKKFEKTIRKLIKNGQVVLCPNMPCIEYWFLLHFENYTDLLENYQKVSNRLSHYMQGSFPKFSDIKKGKYLMFPSWVANLCADGKLDNAIKRAETNIENALADNDLDNQSFSYVYKLFKR